MRRKSRLILLSLILFIVVLLGLGLAATVALGRTTRGGLAHFMVWDGDEINRIAEKIARVDLPPGYEPEVGIRGLGFAMAAYTTGDEHSQLALIQIPEWIPLDEQEIIRQVRASIKEEQADDVASDVTIIEQRAIDLGDHSVFYSIAEGTDSEEVAFRSVQVLYPRRNGKVVLLFEEPIARWDDTRVHALLASLR